MVTSCAASTNTGRRPPSSANPARSDRTRTGCAGVLPTCGAVTSSSMGVPVAGPARPSSVSRGSARTDGAAPRVIRASTASSSTPPTGAPALSADACTPSSISGAPAVVAPTRTVAATVRPFASVQAIRCGPPGVLGDSTVGTAPAGAVGPTVAVTGDAATPAAAVGPVPRPVPISAARCPSHAGSAPGRLSSSGSHSRQATSPRCRIPATGSAGIAGSDVSPISASNSASDPVADAAADCTTPTTSFTAWSPSALGDPVTSTTRSCGACSPGSCSPRNTTEMRGSGAVRRDVGIEDKTGHPGLARRRSCGGQPDVGAGANPPGRRAGHRLHGLAVVGDPHQRHQHVGGAHRLRRGEPHAHTDHGRAPGRLDHQVQRYPALADDRDPGAALLVDEQVGVVAEQRVQRAQQRLPLRRVPQHPAGEFARVAEPVGVQRAGRRDQPDRLREISQLAEVRQRGRHGADPVAASAGGAPPRSQTQ